MSCENSCTFIGRLGGDPIIRQTKTGDSVANFRIAVNERFGFNDDGSPKEITTWVNGVAWRKLGEIVGKFCGKGDMISLQGRMRNQVWKDNDGNDRYSTNIEADSIKFLTPKNGNGNGGGSKPQGNELPPIPEIADDDIPF